MKQMKNKYKRKQENLKWGILLKNYLLVLLVIALDILQTSVTSER